jgi:hypothetical protein
MTDVKSLDFINDSSLWPRWPLLTVKRYPRAGEIECGLMIDSDDDAERWTVFIFNLWILSGSVDLKALIIDNPEVKRFNYPNVNALLADGWEVD